MNDFEPTTNISDMKFKYDNSMPDDPPAPHKGGPDIAPWVQRFTATPSIVSAPGDSVTLAWVSGLADEAIISPGVGRVEPSGSTVVNPSVPITYTLTAINKNGQTQRDATVSISQREPATALALRQVTAISADFDTVEAGLQALEAKYTGAVFPVETSKGMAEAKAARAEIRDARYRVQSAVKEAKRPLNALKSAIEGRGEQIIERIEPIEEPIHQQITRREAQIEAEKAERDRLAAEKARAVTMAIEAILESLTTCANQPVKVIDDHIAAITSLYIPLDVFGDRAGEAEQIKARTLVALVDMRVARTAFEAQQAEVERREQEHRQRQQEEAEAHAARVEAQVKANVEAAQKLAEERIAFLAEQEAVRAEQRKREDADRAEKRRIEEAEEAARRAELLAETERLAQLAEAKEKLHDAAPAMLAELQNIANAERFDHSVFEDDTAFADWAQSRARHIIALATK